MDKNAALFNYILRLADTNLILGHRLSEWCGHAPFLEEDIAMANIALDLIGQSNSLLQYAAKTEGKGRTEDDLAYLRNEREYFNSLLSEQPNGDFAFSIVRQFLSDAFDLHFYEVLKNSKDEMLAALAVKGHKEVIYHFRHTSAWMQRLGDGTDESHERIQKALNELWCFTGDLFEMTDSDKYLVKEGIAVDTNLIQDKWLRSIDEVLEKSKLSRPADSWQQKGSRQGIHTEHLGFLLAEMQHLHRTHPQATW
ncbi:MAG TPA: 1,2-phenylacetyl-CoA epoxidase subunit PaaC [Bacteroidia bacterium]|jgi:ring-1,2-phenylacetyl-CoA epoxidase subunit PaaC|nr:1,2-phenylacetyl-CoA epoxidase subunit PaaC [Bacteroidia bacterium]